MGANTDVEPIDSIDIAIIGMSGRWPGANSVEALWENLRQGVESISFFSDAELLEAGVDPGLLRVPGYVKAGSIIDDVEGFDAAFFGYTPREAEAIDPQQRLFLEAAWTALEHAGYPPLRYPGLIGVFAGVSLNTYLFNNIFAAMGNGTGDDYAQFIIASDKDFLATRVSYKLNLRGPSLTVQSACSTSLVAVHLAVQSLLSYQCDLALAGGVSLSFPHKQGYLYQKGGYLSPDGHCRPFDRASGGTINGNGLGVVVLKRVEEALADGDQIIAVIKGSAINNDGALKIGYTAPSEEGQAAVIAAAQALAGVEPESISYIEAHGTATQLGDPIEVAALTRAFRMGTTRKHFCALGSVKSNFGHLDAAAGVTGLIKTALALRHEAIPPSLNFHEPNPEIDFANSPFYVNNELKPWPASTTPRRAGVSSLGIGGTNAHVILEEAPPVPEPAPEEDVGWQLVLLSAKTSGALDQASARLAEHCAGRPELSLADMAYTLRQRREHLPQRRFLVCTTLAEAQALLEARDPKRVLSGAAPVERRTLAFLFPGGGSQHINMGRDLYESQPVFRAAVDRCVALITPHIGADLREIMYADGEPSPAQQAQFQTMVYALLALFTTEYALAQQWLAWGLQPTMLIGHSLGEYTAACVAGSITLEEAIALVALRGRLFERVPEGSCVSVALPADEVRSLLGKDVYLAVVNGPGQCVVSGTSEAVAGFEAKLSALGVQFRRLAITTAAHSPLLAPILPEFGAYAGTIKLRPPKIPYISNVTGDWIGPAELNDPLYWSRHLGSTVRFAEGIQRVLSDPACVMLEVGPGQVLTTLTRGQPNLNSNHVVVSSCRHPQDQQSDLAVLLGALGRLWLGGLPLSWERIFPEPRRHVWLPTYPFEHERYWLAPAAGAAPARRAARAAGAADVLYRPIWKDALPLTAGPAPAEERRDWLLFSDGAGLGSQLIERLRRTGQRVVCVGRGRGFSQPGDLAYLLNPANSDDFSALVESLSLRRIACDRILYLWGLEDQQGRAGARPRQRQGRQQGPGALSTSQDRVSGSVTQAAMGLLSLGSALAGAGLEGQVELLLPVSQSLWVTGYEAIDPQSAVLTGAAQAVRLLSPAVRCRLVDVELADTPDAQPRALDQLLGETAAPRGEAVVAYRGRKRWTQGFEPLGATGALGADGGLAAGGTAVVFDGSSGAGLTLAQHLLEQSRALLVVEPADFPPRHSWDAWRSAHGPDDLTSQKIVRLEALLREHSALLVVSAALDDHPTLEALLAETASRFGAPRYLIHAGLVDEIAPSRPTPESDLPETLGRLRKHLDGIHTLCQRQQLACMLLAPLSGWVGAARSATEIVAQALVLALLEGYRGAGDRWGVVQWDGWQLHDPSEHGGSVSAETVCAVFEQGSAALAAGCILVSGSDLVDRVTRAEELPTAAAAQASAPARHQRPNLPTPYAPARSEAEALLVRCWEETLGVHGVGIHDNFFDLRGDSLLGLRMIARISQEQGVEIDPRLLFENPTIGELAAQLVGLGASTTAEGPPPVLTPSLVRLQPGAGRPPFFCAHPSGGLALCYAELARLLGPAQPFFGIQARGADGRQPPRTTIGEMATSYLVDIRRVQPEGPYYLGGWSMGGLIALELAQQLRQAGETVALLALIDTPTQLSGVAPEALDDAALAFSMLGPELQIAPATLRRVPKRDQLAYLMERAHERRYFPPEFDMAQLQRLIHTFRTHAQACWAYRPQPYDGPTVLLRAAEAVQDNVLLRFTTSADPALGWRSYMENLRVRPIAGNHQTLIYAPHVRTLADQLSQALAEAYAQQDAHEDEPLALEEALPAAQPG